MNKIKRVEMPSSDEFNAGISQAKGFYERLANAQMEVGKVFKDAANPFFKNKYATLDKIMQLIKPALFKNRLTLVPVHRRQGEGLPMMMVVAIKSWDCDKEVITELEMLLGTKKDMQGLGSASTYGCRYNVLRLMAIEVDAETDGEDIAIDIADRTSKNSSGEYVINVGKKYIGLTLKEVDKNDLKGFYEWMIKMNPDGGKGKAKVFIDECRAFLK